MVLVLILIAIIVGVWLHSMGHYLFSRFILKLPTRVLLGFKNGSSSESKDPGIQLGWFPFFSRFELLFGEISKEGSKLPRVKLFSSYFVGILLSSIFGFLFLVLGHLTSQGTLEKTPTLQKPLAIVGDVVPGGPAEKAGIKPLDKVVVIEGQKIKYFEDLQKSVQESTGPVKLTVLRGQEKFDVTLTPMEGQYRQKIIGIAVLKPKVVYRNLSFGESIRAGLTTTSSFFKIFIKPFEYSKPQSNVGVIRISSLNPPKPQSLSLLFFYIGYVSLTLVFWNLIPLPPFDLGNSIGFASGISFQKIKKLRIPGIFIFVGILLFKFWDLYLR